MFQPMTTVYKTRLSYRFIIICMHGPKKWGPRMAWLPQIPLWGYLCLWPSKTTIFFNLLVIKYIHNTFL